MDVQDALQRMYHRALTAPKVTSKPNSPLLEDALDLCLSKGWSAEDLIESQVDELSTAASVGSGVAKALPPEREEYDEKATLEKILAQFEGYRRHMGLTEVRARDVYKFIDEVGLPENLGEAFTTYLKGRKII